jgi:hypothetical protein
MIRLSAHPQFAVVCRALRSPIRPLTVMAILLPVIAPNVVGMVSLRDVESSSPAGSEEEIEVKSEEYLANRKRRIRVSTRHRRVCLISHRAIFNANIYHSSQTLGVDGHRLLNGLLAPMIC